MIGTYPPLLLGYVCIGQISKGAEESWIDLAVEADLVGYLTPKCGGWTPRRDVGSSGHSISLEGFREFGLL